MKNLYGMEALPGNTGTCTKYPDNGLNDSLTAKETSGKRYFAPLFSAKATIKLASFF